MNKSDTNDMKYKLKCFEVTRTKICRTTITEIEYEVGWGYVGSTGKGNSMMWLRVGTGCNRAPRNAQVHSTHYPSWTEGLTQWR